MKGRMCCRWSAVSVALCKYSWANCRNTVRILNDLFSKTVWNHRPDSCFGNSYKLALFELEKASFANLNTTYQKTSCIM